MTKHILIIEDQEDINNLIAMHLESLNFNVTQCTDGLKGFELASEHSFDLLVLDIMLPGMDGLHICQSLRAKRNNVPILMLTAKKSEAERVIGLEVGADDYLTKPFSILELQARIKAMFRRLDLSQISEESSTAILSFGEFKIDLKTFYFRQAFAEYL